MLAWKVGRGVLNELLPHFFHRGALESMRKVAAFGGLQTDPRAPAKLVHAERCDVDEEKSAVDGGRNSQWLVMRRMRYSH